MCKLQSYLLLKLIYFTTCEVGESNILLVPRISISMHTRGLINKRQQILVQYDQERRELLPVHLPVASGVSNKLHIDNLIYEM